MRLRITDAKTAAVEFDANSADELRREINQAAVKLAGEIGQTPIYIQIHVERRDEWGSPLYPHSNAELSVPALMTEAKSESLWSELCKGAGALQEFARQLAGMMDFAAVGNRELRRIK